MAITQYELNDLAYAIMDVYEDVKMPNCSWEEWLETDFTELDRKYLNDWTAAWNVVKQRLAAGCWDDIRSFFSAYAASEKDWYCRKCQALIDYMDFLKNA